LIAISDKSTKLVPPDHFAVMNISV